MARSLLEFTRFTQEYTLSTKQLPTLRPRQLTYHLHLSSPFIITQPEGGYGKSSSISQVFNRSQVSSVSRVPSYDDAITDVIASVIELQLCTLYIEKVYYPGIIS